LPFAHEQSAILKAGDFFRSPPRSTHGQSRTRTGCQVLITSAISEEFAAAWR